VAEHLRKQSGTTKRNPLSRGPIQITKQNGKNNFSPKLPLHWKINSSFHISKLKLVQPNDPTRFPLRESEPPSEPDIQPDGTEEWYVEKIVDHRILRNGRKLYRVRWKCWIDNDDAWEPVENLRKVKKLIHKYEDVLAQLNTLAYKEVILKPRVLARLNATKLINPDRIDQPFSCKTTTRIGQRCKNRTRRPIRGNYVLQLNRKEWINTNRSVDIGGFANDCRYINKR